MKKSELKKIIQEELKNTLNEQSQPSEWRDVASIFKDILSDIEAHDQYAYADGNEVDTILNNLINYLSRLNLKKKR